MAEVVIKAIHRIYANVIIAGSRKFASVPTQDKDGVRAALIEKGYSLDENGEIQPI